MKELKIIDNQILFYISFGIFLILTLLRSSFYYQFFMGTIFKAGLAVCVLLILVNEIIFGRLEERGYISIIICTVFVILFFVANVRQYKVMTATVLFIIAARKIPFKNIARYAAIISALFLIVVIVSAYAGIIPNHIEDRGDSFRYYLGFLYSLYPATIMTNISLLVIYYRKNHIFWWELLILLAANVWIFQKTGARLAFIISFLGLLISCLLKLKPNFFVTKKRLMCILAFSFVVLAIISIIISLEFDSSVGWQAKANTFLSSRLSLQHEAIQKYGISLFGQDINANGNGLNPFGENPTLLTEKYFYVDNEYILWLTSNGVIFFLLMVSLLTAVCLKCRKYDKQGYLLMIFVLLAFQCTIQDSFLCIYYNTFLLAIGNVLIGNKEESVLLRSSIAHKDFCC